jgi:hypothetical protein
VAGGAPLNGLVNSGIGMSWEMRSRDGAPIAVSGAALGEEAIAKAND